MPPHETNGRSRVPGFNRKRLFPNDADLLKLQEQAAEHGCEAKPRDPTGPNELVSTMVDAVARRYFKHVIRKKQRGES
jgi:hypothetical protein